MRIASLNAWGGAMADELLAWLPTCDASVLCLQEVTRTAGLTGWTRFADGERELPQRASLLDDVRSALPRHQALFVASDTGPVSDGGGRRYRQDFGLGTFLTDGVTPVGLTTAFVHGRYTDHAEWTVADRPRVAQSVRVHDPAADRFVTVVQCHGLRDPAGKHDTAARREQARRLAALVDGSREPGDVTVVCGDLNLLPDSETFGVLADIGLVDLVGTSDTRTSRYPKPVRHAGYLLVSDPTAVADFRIVATPEVSDHRALVLDLQ